MNSTQVLERVIPLVGKLEQCPACTYSLQGLPLNHRCPECGLPYDQFSGCWTSSTLKTKRLLFAAFCGVAAAATLVITLSRTGAMLTLSGATLSAGAVLWAVSSLNACRAAFSNEFVLAGPTAIYWRKFGKTVSVLPWAELSGIHVRKVGRRVFVQLQSNVARKPIDLSPILRDEKNVEAFQAIWQEYSRLAFNSMRPAQVSATETV